MTVQKKPTKARKWRNLVKASATAITGNFETIFLACVLYTVGILAPSVALIIGIIALVSVIGIIYLTKRRRLWTSALLITVAMIPAIKEKLDRLNAWQEKSEERVIEQAQAFESEILEMNTEEQLFTKGIDATGRPIQPRYTPYTVRLKRARGQVTSHVTLQDEGDFYASFEVLWLPKLFLISATDWKRVKLAEKYGAAIFGLNEESIETLRGMLREPVLAAFKTQVG